MNTSQLISTPRPVDDYHEALQRIETLKSQDDETINPKSYTQLLTHGYKTKRVVVWFHGYTNSPAQFFELGKLCYAQGANVFIPRAPYHGYKDRLAHSLSKLTAEKIVAYADDAVDIAGGLGEHITIGGLSMGGVITAWLAQQRADITQAIVISPAFGGRVIPTSATKAVTEVLLVLPNMFRWWDPKSMDFTVEPLHAYPRFSTRGLGQIFRLGFAVQAMARQGEPSCTNIWMIINANDVAVNNEISMEVAQYWSENAIASIHSYTFPAELNLIHDLIDPLQPRQKIDKVYPVLMDMIRF